ncbi:glycosyl hydrolase 108 family protein [Agrobacterium sp.]|uniref:glycosyl hydrolase 108 family protein n=1 Tax=Agrobacterium sp. TaxID=361 RepID=UPI0028B040B6
MAKDNYGACLDFTLQAEGGLSKDRKDPGNWTGGKVGVGTFKGTKYGISAASFPHLDIANLTLSDVKPLYKIRYWDAVGGDSLPAGFDLAVWDYGVNSGPARALREAQAIVGAKVDGKIGPETITKSATAGVKHIQSLCARRLSFMRYLKIWSINKNGWSARVAKVEAKGVAMYLAATGTSAAARQTLAAEGQKASDKAATQANQGALLGTGGTVGVSAGVPSWTGFSLAMVGVLLATLVIFAIYRKNRQRAEAYRAEAAALKDRPLETVSL